MPRINNNIPTSHILAIYPYPGGIMPRLGIIIRTIDGEEKPETLERSQIAEFLNSATDIEHDGKNRIISREIEDAILSNTDGTITRKGNKYLYSETALSRVFETKQQSGSVNLEAVLPQRDNDGFVHRRTLSEVRFQPILSEPKLSWECKITFDAIVAIANDVLRNFPNSKIYSLGQSPAWIVKASEMLTIARGKQEEFGYIPFSGSFLDRRQEYSGGFYIGDRLSPSIQIQKKYREILQGIGLAPSEIIVRAKKGKKTIILEYTNSGQSVASFVLILFSWAKEEGLEKELNKALDIVTFERRNSLPPTINLFIEPLEINIGCKNLKTENAIMVFLANGEDEGSKSDRLVPKYNQHLWHLPPAPLTGNAEHIKMLSERLQQSVLESVAIDPVPKHLPRDRQVGLAR